MENRIDSKILIAKIVWARRQYEAAERINNTIDRIDTVLDKSIILLQEIKESLAQNAER